MELYDAIGYAILRRGWETGTVPRPDWDDEPGLPVGQRDLQVRGDQAGGPVAGAGSSGVISSAGSGVRSRSGRYSSRW